MPALIVWVSIFSPRQRRDNAASMATPIRSMALSTRAYYRAGENEHVQFRFPIEDNMGS
jgi:hypothetical protein